MKKGSAISLGTIIALLSFASCDKEKQENECVSYTTAQVTKVAGPNSVPVYHETDLTVFYYLTNGCGKFENMEATSSGNTTIISFKAKYEGCFCTDNLVSGQSVYKFKAEQPGVYYLKFLQPNKTYLTDTITVN